MHLRDRILAIGFLCTSALASAQPGVAYTVIPMKPDPAIVADADLSDWALVPNALDLRGRQHVTYGPDLWQGNEDLSGTVRLCWRPGLLAIAAVVTDSNVLQPFAGRDIWRGDHVNLWIDFQPGVHPERTMFGDGQVHAVVSPGNFADIPPRNPRLSPDRTESGPWGGGGTTYR